MSFVTTKLSKKVFIKKETTQGEFENPSNSDALEVLPDFSMEKSRETIEDIFETGSRLSKKDELSTKSISSTLPVRLSAGPTLGSDPNSALLLEAFGYKNRGLNADVTTGTGHTTTEIQIEDADISKFTVGDIVFFKSGTADNKIIHKSPITAKDSTLGAASITLLIPFGSAPDDNIVISASKVYALDVDQAQDTSLSVVQQLQGDVELRGWGMKTQSFSLEGFGAGQKPSMSFTLTGINFADIIGTARTPIYNIINNAWVRASCVWMNATKIPVSELSHSQEQTLTAVKTTCHENNTEILLPTGEYTVNTTFNPRKSQGDLGVLLDNSVFSLFWSTGTPIDEEATEIDKNIAFYIPKNKSVSSNATDADGYMVDSVTANMQSESMADSPIIAFC